MNSDRRGAGLEVGEEGFGTEDAVESNGHAKSDMMTRSHSSARSDE